MDIPRVAACVPGMEEVVQEEDGSYRARMRVRVGPMGLTLAGTLQVLEQDPSKGEARFLIEASDRKVGGAVRADLIIHLRSEEGSQTELVLNTDTTFIGRLGELGQPLIRRKANNTMEEFARNLARQLSHP